MGILYETVKKVNLKQQERQRQFILEELQKKGITETQEGTPIELLDYDRLKEELVLAEFRRIDVETDANRWF